MQHLSPADQTASILVITAAPEKMDVLLRTLSDAGYDVRVVQHDEGAWEQAKHSPPSLLLLDLAGECAGGEDILGRLRSHLAIPDDEVLTLQALERAHFISVLKRTHGVIEGPRGAARLLNLKPSTARFRMKKLGISRSDYLKDA